MTKKEFVERNIGMTFDFIKQLIDHPETIESIPDGVELDFVDKEMPLKIKEQVKGKKVVRYKVEHVFEPIK
ncbi:MAG: hypothetical protein FJ264_07690 [Planctomycetes bacterium]|nr:hypothetical protein [Planctomycetota bacterium]